MSYRKNRKGLPGSPDFSNEKHHWALFVQGCFWHHHRCRRGTTPTRNRNFWTAKFDANRLRDARKVRALKHLGFKVVLVWECEVLAKEPMIGKLLRLAATHRCTTACAAKSEIQAGKAPCLTRLEEDERRGET